MVSDVSYRTVEELCSTIQRLTEIVSTQEAENAQLRALLREERSPPRRPGDEDDEKTISGLLEED